MESIINFLDKNKKFNIIFSIGKYSQQFGFDEQLFNFENYCKIKKLLDSCKSWKTIEEEIIEDFKENFKIIDFKILTCKNSPFDIKIIAYEKIEYVESIGFSIKRIEYTRKDHTFQIEENCLFKFSLKLINNLGDSTYLAHSSYLKILDIIKIYTPENFDLKYQCLT